MIDTAALRAVIEERLRLAREATPGPWAWGPIDMRKSGKLALYSVLRKPFTPGHWPGLIVLKAAEADVWPQKTDAHFIVANDPAFVIRQCERDLRVLDRHGLLWREIGWRVDDDTEYAELPVCERCVPKHSHFRSREEVPIYPCDEVRDLAAVWTPTDTQEQT